ncbi:MAG TPA: alginate O-acetyltransferase AlgF [Trueperaceae bacterium]
MARAIGTSASFRTVEPLPGRHPSGPIAVLLAVKLAALLGALLLWPAAVKAQGGLYGPEAPRDVAYVRLINARPGGPVGPVVGGEEWQSVDFAEVSPYHRIAPGQHAVSAAGIESSFTARAESFTTLVLLENELVTIDDTPLRDISRGLLTLYNLTADHTLTLGTVDGSQVISDVEPLSAASRAISQAEVELVVSSNGKPIGKLDSRLYRRGEAHSVIVMPEGTQPRVIYARAAAER